MCVNPAHNGYFLQASEKQGRWQQDTTSSKVHGLELSLIEKWTIRWSSAEWLPCGWARGLGFHATAPVLGFPGGTSCKEPTCQCRRCGFSLSWEDPLEKGMATHSSILALRIPWTEEPGGLQSMGSQSQTQLKWLSRHAEQKHNWKLGIFCIPSSLSFSALFS